MGSFRIETITDQGSGHIAVEIRRADGAILAHSGPVFASEADAEDRIVEAISKAWPSQPIDPVYPSNGS